MLVGHKLVAATANHYHALTAYSTIAVDTKLTTLYAFAYDTLLFVLRCTHYNTILGR